MEKALVELLQKAAHEFSNNELLILDIGIFPWFNSIEISFLFTEDKCDRSDIAAWPHYDYSKLNEGGWNLAKPYAEELAKEWRKNPDIISILKRESKVVKLPSVCEALSKLKLAESFKIQVLNSDDNDSPNYCG